MKARRGTGNGAILAERWLRPRRSRLLLFIHSLALYPFGPIHRRFGSFVATANSQPKTTITTSHPDGELTQPSISAPTCKTYGLFGDRFSFLCPLLLPNPSCAFVPPSASSINPPLIRSALNLLRFWHSALITNPGKRRWIAHHGEKRATATTRRPWGSFIYDVINFFYPFYPLPLVCIQN